MSESNYNDFLKRLEAEYPRAMRNVYCGISIDEGWYKIVERLVAQMRHHIKWKRERRTHDLRLNRAIKQGRDAVMKFVTKGKAPSMYDENRVDEYMENGPVEPTEYVSHIEIHQIKEKFGGLRFYFQGGDEYCRGLEVMAEEWAANTCEICGERGSVRSGGWMKSLCDAHEAERQKRYQEREV